MEKGISAAPCKYCHQMVQIEDGLKTDEEQINAATLRCNCTGAQYFQQQERKKEKAFKNIKLLFGENAPEENQINNGIVHILRAAVVAICGEKVESITMNLNNGVKAKISQNSKGEIIVERTETAKQKLTN